MELSQPAVRLGGRIECPERPLCHCFGVSHAEVQETIEQNDLVSVRGITQVCGAGGGCTACHRHLKRLLNENAVAKRLQHGSIAYSAE
ncbi:(2Fe-2S)-binding protein [Schlesneria paludicola]|uniref:(2Fe-2S)-binding protein n=1 Tax=Schlesneria paludicola TaxID=360056 RepID=UPI0002F4B4E0|nr:(2Fe-2S)-binding protein [Schlesneria paludicola]